MTTTLPQTFLNDLLSRVDLVHIIEYRIKLQKKGKNIYHIVLDILQTKINIFANPVTNPVSTLVH